MSISNTTHLAFKF